LAKKKKYRGLLRKLIGFVVIAGVLSIMLYAVFWGIVAWDQFGSKQWELPARIYSRPLELYPGLPLNPELLEKELILMSYRKGDSIDVPGSYCINKNVCTLFSRPFSFPDGEESSQKIRIEIRNGTISGLTDIETNRNINLARLDPALIGSFYPDSDEDRLWVKFDDAPPLLIQTILAVEDRDFYHHHGIKILSMLRALKTNIMAGKAIQGASTLTQQLVKNLFLSTEKTLIRKINEAIMALSLELFYDKNKIFEAYINEVYLGQDGNRAIHGFGMASRFYFGRSLDDLCAREIALLVGLLKGPSYYNPYRFTERALKRRNVVLSLMADQILIRPAEAQQAMKKDLGVISNPQSGISPFPSFLDFVKRNLLREYDETDLETEGLRIFSTMVPKIQFAVEKSVKNRLETIERSKNLPFNSLEAAVVITGVGNNEIVALTGGRNPKIKGFNRALDSRRLSGSLIKPVIYLSALAQSEKYTLISSLNDSPIQVKTKNGVWEPKNYDRQFHGNVPLFEALSNSYNAATVRLGMEMGLDTFFETLHKLGIHKNLPPYPSVLLGAVGISPLEAAQMYQTFAAGGFFSPVRVIQAVCRPDGHLLQRYPLTVNETINPDTIYLLNKALQIVISEGTGRSLNRVLAEKLTPAGKTGTTDDLRDSWFAGFTGDYTGAVWVGRDDNAPCGLTGASGAMQVWGDIMAKISTSPLQLSKPDNIIITTIDPITGCRTEKHCPGSFSFPFIAGSEPKDFVPCEVKKSENFSESGKTEKQDKKTQKTVPSKIFQWFKELL
jgi:penicillin-binding protein 1B